MPPKNRRKKLSKAQKKELLKERGRLGAVARGVGVGGRKDFVLPAKWETHTKVYASHEAMKVVSPNKTTYHNMEKVKRTLAERGMELCVHRSSEESSGDASASEFEPSPLKKMKNQPTEGSTLPKEQVVERQLFVCESSQVTALVDEVNKTSRCATKDCNGILVPSKIESVGLGGTINVKFVCNGCQSRTVSFQGSSLVEGLRRTVVGLALAVAFIVSGHGFAKFNRTLNQYLGIPALSKNRFYEVIKLLYPHIHDILSEMCEEEKSNMKGLDKNVLGSWDQAVVTSDGVWHTRGHFSKNGSFIVKNYQTGGLLWFGHKCMRGTEEEEEEEELFKGTSKSMEGVLVEECYGQAKEEGCQIAVVWQDGDSAARKSVENVYGEEPKRVYKCGRHVGRAYGNNLKDLAKQNVFSATQVSRWKGKFDGLDKLKCECKRHSKRCGCLSEQFTKNARVNHFCCLQQCKNASEYARRMRDLAEHHCRDVHSWEGGKCGFHYESVCSCGECEDEEEYTCQGRSYSTKNQLKCSFHHMAYRIECELRANDADSLIHPEMGRGHSNQCEAHFSVLPHFRAKDQRLCRLHYIASTNCGLAQGNMTWCYENRGKEYHWVKDLYQRLNLPILSAVVHALEKATEVRMTELLKRQTEVAKKKRVSHEVARLEDQEEQKKWGKRRAILHTYGTDDDVSNEGEDDPDLVKEAQEIVGDATTVVSGKQCKCKS